MDIQKLELLLKKISQAVKTIQTLKDNEINYKNDIDKLNNEILLLKEENLNLKKELQKNNILHNELEDKIVEILKYLPEDDENPEIKSQTYDPTAEKENSDIISTDNQSDNSFIPEKNIEEINETEEDMLKKFVNEQKNRENLFLSETNDFPSINLPSEDTKSQFMNIETKEEEISKKFELDFNKSLLDTDAENIEFNFEDRQNDDLPKGVL
jgi:hypothetical protein